MSDYIPLSLRLRPQYFRDFVYNEPIILILKNMIQQNRVPSSIMFSGGRGIGKTTLARILSRAINCTGRGKDYEPCGKCDSCKESLQGIHPDIIEIDGATHSGIDDVRKILEQAMHSPMLGEKKIFIIDEAHNLNRSVASFDAMLKILEEPPESVIWLFCTTAKSKFPETIKSRMVALDLRMVPTSILATYITKVLNAEDTSIDTDQVAPVVANLAGNSVRDALTLLEKVIPYCNEKGWSRGAVIEAVGAFDVVKVPDLLHMLGQRSSGGLWALLDQILESGVDAEVLFEAVTKIINNLMTISLGGTVEGSEVYFPLMDNFPVPRVIYLSNIILKRARDLQVVTNQKMVMQMLALELCV